MATRRWLSGAPAVKQVVTLTVGGTVEAGDKFKVTCNGQTISTSATTTSTSTTASEVKVALAASTIAEFLEVVWTVTGAVVTGTAVTAGKPFTVTVATTESDDSAADTQTFVLATSTANSGPHDWSTAANWSGTAVPIAADDVYLDVPVDILYGLAQSAVTLTSLTIPESFGMAKIGLPENTGAYAEYRGTYLAISATTITIQCLSGRLKLNVGTIQTTMHVRGTGKAVEPGLEALLFKGTHASNVINVTKGYVGVALFGGETAVIATLRVGYESSVYSDATVRCSTGVTLTTIEQTGGRLETNSAVTTMTKTGGTWTHKAGAVTTVHERGGVTYYTSTGTLTTLNVAAGGAVDYSQNNQARTVSACNITAGSKISDPHKSVTWTAGVDLENCGLAEVSLDFGRNVRLTPGAVA